MEELHVPDARVMSGGDAIVILNAARIRTFPVRLCELEEGYSEGVTKECIRHHRPLFVFGVVRLSGVWAGGTS
jgi:hypothetical protein